MEHIILPLLLCSLMQSNISSQGGFNLAGIANSGPTSPTACCDAWVETKALDHRPKSDFECVKRNYNNSNKNHWAQRVDYDLELAFQHTVLMANPVFPIVQLSTQNAFHSQISLFIYTRAILKANETIKI